MVREATVEKEGRARGVRRLAEHLRRSRSPRAGMAAMVAATGVAGFLSSAALLRLGLEAMWARYSLSVVAAYLVFLLLVGIWMCRERARLARLGSLPPAGDEGAGEDSLEEGHPVLRRTGRGAFDIFVERILDFLSLEEAGFVLIAVGLVIASVIGVVLVVVDAPVLLAEVLLDGLLSAGLYRRLRRVEGGGHWLGSAVRCTWRPFLAVFLLFLGTGAVFAAIAPGAHSIGGVIRALGR